MIKSENRKIKYTKHALEEALRELMHKKSIEQISVTELCRQADINRTTFYKYYTIPGDILDELGNTLALHLDQANALAHDTIYKQTLAWSKVIYEDMEDWKLVTSGNRNQTHFLQTANEEWISHFRDRRGLSHDQGTRLFLFVQYGVAGLTSDWISKENPESPELFATHVSEIMELVL